MDSTYNSLLVAPRFTSSTDKLIYRRDVREWMDGIRCMADDYPDARAIASRMGRALYMRMEPYYRNIVGYEADFGKLNLEHDSTDAGNNQTVGKIIELVAKDSKRDVIRRLVNMCQEIIACTREPSESYSLFADKFQSKVHDFFSYCNPVDESPTKQFLAVLLLDNANLCDGVLNLSSIAKETSDSAKESSNFDPSIICEKAPFSVSLDLVLEELKMLSKDSDYNELRQRRSYNETPSMTVTEASTVPSESVEQSRSKRKRNYLPDRTRGIQRSRGWRGKRREAGNKTRSKPWSGRRSKRTASCSLCNNERHLGDCGKAEESSEEGLHY